MTELVLKSLYLNWRHQQSRPTLKNTLSLPEVLQFWATFSEEMNQVSQLRESTVAWGPRRSARPEPAKLPKGQLQDRWQFNTQIYLETSLIPMVRSGAGARHRSGSCILRCGWAPGLRSERRAEENTETSSDSIQERLQKASKETKQHIELLPRLPIQGKEKMCFYWYIVWKEIFTAVNLALWIPALSCSPSHLLQERPPCMEIIKLLTSQDQWVLK